MQRQSVAPEDRTLRRIQPLFVVRDPKAPNGIRASSSAFQDDHDGSPLSAYLESVLLEGGLAHADVIGLFASKWGMP